MAARPEGGEAPTFCVIIICAGAAEVDLVEMTLDSLDGQTALCSIAVLADVDLHHDLRQLRSPGGVPVELPVEAPVLNCDAVCLVRAGGRLLPGALKYLQAALAHAPDIDLIYADDAADLDGRRLLDPRLRPGFAPDRLLAHMYLGEFVVISVDLLHRVGASVLADRLACTLSSPLPHATALVVSHLARRVAHLPQVLYLRSLAISGDVSLTSDSERVDRFLSITGMAASAESRDDVVALQPNLAAEPSVSVIIPTIGAERDLDGRPTVLVNQAVASLARLTHFRNVDLTIVLGANARPGLAEEIGRAAGHLPVRFVSDDRPFNFSHACNLGAVASSGDYLVFLNDDVRITDERWLSRLMMFAICPDVGAVGARLLYPDGRIQHAGIWTRGGHPVHRYESYAQESDGYLNSLRVPNNVLAVTGACLAVAHHKFDHVGGFSPLFPSSYNDVDLCLKLLDVGWRSVVSPEPAMIHFEASSRDPSISEVEMELLHDRWRSLLNADPFDNPNHAAVLSEELPAPNVLNLDANRQHGPRLWPRQTLPAADIRLDQNEAAVELAATSGEPHN